MKELVFLLEEESARVLIESLLPRLIPSDHPAQVRFVVFDGKQDLERSIERKLKHYLNPEARFLVLRDQDDHPNCRKLKSQLVKKCSQAGRPNTIVRLACRELESFYLGDLQAVERGLGIEGLANHQGKAKYRNPDELPKPSIELAKLTKERYQKVSGSRAIGPHLRLAETRSTSFRHLLNSIRLALSELALPARRRISKRIVREF